jgi:hypothetical protein
MSELYETLNKANYKDMVQLFDERVKIEHSNFEWIETSLILKANGEYEKTTISDLLFHPYEMTVKGWGIEYSRSDEDFEEMQPGIGGAGRS